jgi:prepilin-type N-terminal cleavage/methylation domain-containing protein
MNQHRKQKIAGFSLIELMIVIAIIGLLIAVGVPAWSYMVRNGNENAAIQTLRQINQNQAGYRTRKGKYGTFDDLIKETEFNENFKGEKPVFNGYVYTMSLRERSAGQAPFFSVKADPESATSGTRHFYIDSDKSTIKVNDEGEATADSPSLQGS